MHPARRAWLTRLAVAAAGWATLPATGQPAGVAADPDPIRRGRALRFPRDHGAHLGARTEWWYATGWLSAGAATSGASNAAAPAEPTHGFQVTFFRSRTGLAADNPSRFAARQLLFAHAAVTVLADGRHLHDQRIARWSGAPDAPLGAAATDDGFVRLGPWRMHRQGEAWQALLPAEGFALELKLARSQPLLLQGDAGFSRKGPDEVQASHYYSEPQLAATGSLQLGHSRLQASGRAWLDHEWSEEILHPEAVGWDWIGINLLDGGALTVFVLRRADGSPLWAGGSHRSVGGSARAFAPGDVQMLPGRLWRSPATDARYPVIWQIRTPAGRHTVRALLDAQELDSRDSTGTVYWEGLSELLDEAGRRVGLGYLEMTGYAQRLRLN
jgi:predicted secreted hydrolase